MPFYIIVIIISFIASIIGLSLKENRNAPLTYFPFFLLLTAVVEYYGLKWSLRNLNTNLLYNLFTLVEFLFYFNFFKCLFQNPAIKKTISMVMVIFFILTIINIIFFQGKFYIKGKGFSIAGMEFHTYTYMLGSLLVVIFSILYFNLLFRFPETGRLTRNPYFWIVTGVMFFEICTFTVYGLNNFIAQTMRQYDRVLTLVSDFLNVLLYTSFTIGFLCRIKIRKLSWLS